MLCLTLYITCMVRHVNSGPCNNTSYEAKIITKISCVGLQGKDALAVN